MSGAWTLLAKTLSTENLWTLDGGRTIGWEFADQLGTDSVDHVLVQVGGGALLTSCAIGLLAALRQGSISPGDTAAVLITGIQR